MDINTARDQGLELVNNSKAVMLGTIGKDGFPQIKALMNMKNDGLKEFWFSTNTSSKRVQCVKDDNRACVYFVDKDNFQGLMLKGTLEVLQDIESRKMLWNDASKRFYPLGVEDPDYSVLHFVADKGNYYSNLENLDFTIE